MNERIKQLAEQATSYNNSDGWLFDKEKFAELIVKECSGIVQNYMSRWPEDHDLTERIKKHFGVEE
jgi:hypothetical protein